MKKVIPSDAVLIPDEAKQVFKGVIFDVYQWDLERFDGSKSTWEMIKRPDTVGAICVVDDKLLILEEDQPHRGGTVNFPGGRADVDDTVLGAIQREVLEEVGYKFKSWRLISVRQPHPKLEWFVHVYLAWDVVSVTEPNLDPGEKITAKFLEFDEVKELTQSNKRFIKEDRDIFEPLNSLQDLLKVPEYQGQEVNR